MPYRITSFEPTPNPNALKLMVEPSPASTPRSYFNPAQAAEDSLAKALFDVDGVTNVLIHAAFITVGKRPEAPWRAIRVGVERALAAAD
ncbi:MAG: NifU N-terminal domain-containing protein [Phycisphaerales bacterium]